MGRWCSLPPPGRPSGDAVEPAATGQAVALPVAASSAGQPGGARLVAWSAFGLGIAASVAANVAHAHPALGPRIAAAFAPVALLLAVECMIRPRWGRAGFWWGLTRYGGTGLVALVAAVMSYRHMCALLVSYDEDQLNAAIGPLAVDGLMVVAGSPCWPSTTPTQGGQPMSRRMNVRAAVVLAASSTMMAGLLFTALAPLDPPTPIDCSPYAGVSQALQGAAEHISAPQGTPAPPNPAVRTSAPVHCG